jgi:threonylcarbamoyladenosine tRNA methylthiotransferase MtaB
MEKFSILTLGCKVNQYESQQIRELLERAGLNQVDVASSPDLVIINTCCVTRTASAKSQHLLHQAQRHDPEAIVICGCLPTVQIDELTATAENLHVVRDQCDLASTLSLLINAHSTTPDSESPTQSGDPFIRAEEEPKVKRKNDLCPPSELPPLARFEGHTRAFLKIQDGCDAFCTYCIIPRTRPRVHSKAPDKVLSEAAALVASGHKEIVVTGIHIGAYGQPTVRRRHWAQPENPHLPEILHRLARVPGLDRIRLSSLDPADVTPALLDALAEHRNIMPHLHLSLQSGSDNILRRMARPYTAAAFTAKVKMIRSRLERPAITTDIIVGFPSETDTDFRKTFDLARELGFAKIHVFPFSPRAGTAATRMAHKVASEVVKERSLALRELDQRLQRQFRGQFLGQTAEVLIETTGDRPAGRTERYFMAYLNETSKADNNDIISVKIVKNLQDGVLGTAT